MTKNELLPCPFCGEQPEIRFLKLGIYKFIIICMAGLRCHIQPYEQGDNKEVLKKHWNKRV